MKKSLRTVARHATRQRGKGAAEAEPLVLQGPVNISGFAAFPAELILEIVSYFPSVPIPFDGEVLDKEYYHGHATLRLLSQLCRSFRRALLPFIWRKIEACAVSKDILGGMKISDPKCKVWEKKLATELAEQLEVVTIRMPEYATHVQTVSIVLGEFSKKSILAELARCLALLPNVKTLQLSFPHYGPEGTNIFRRYRYPGIKTLVVPQAIVAIINSCPGVRYLHLVHGGGKNHPFWDFADLKGVEKLTGRIPYEFLQHLGDKTPNLTHLRVMNIQDDCGLDMRHIQHLSSLSKLQIFEIQKIQRRNFSYLDQSSEVLHQMLATVRDFMRRSPPEKGVTRYVSVLPAERPQCKHV